MLWCCETKSMSSSALLCFSPQRVSWRAHVARTRDGCYVTLRISPIPAHVETNKPSILRIKTHIGLVCIPNTTILNRYCAHDITLNLPLSRPPPASRWTTQFHHRKWHQIRLIQFLFTANTFPFDWHTGKVEYITPGLSSTASFPFFRRTRKAPAPCSQLPQAPGCAYSSNSRSLSQSGQTWSPELKVAFRNLSAEHSRLSAGLSDWSPGARQASPEDRFLISVSESRVVHRCQAVNNSSMDQLHAVWNISVRSTRSGMKRARSLLLLCCSCSCAWLQHAFKTWGYCLNKVVVYWGVCGTVRLWRHFTLLIALRCAACCWFCGDNSFPD